jgi:hypothetical protein
MSETTIGSENAPGFEPVINADVQVNTGSSDNPAPAGEGTQSGEGEGNPAKTTTPDESGNTQSNQTLSDDMNSETPSTDAPSEFQEIINGWKEDRTALAASETENRTLRDQNEQLKNRLSRYETSEDEGDRDFDGLSRQEQERLIVERHEKQKAEAEERTKAEVAREIAFHERTDPEFRANKPAILKIAASFNATSLDQAKKIWKAQFTASERTRKAAEIEAARKREAANGIPGGTDNSKPVIQGYNPQVDGNKSIRDMYREGGIV